MVTMEFGSAFFGVDWKLTVTEGPEYCVGWYERGMGWIFEVRRAYDDFLLLKTVNGRVVWDACE